MSSESGALGEAFERVRTGGTVVVITTELRPQPSAAAHADFADAVVDSIRIDRP